MNLLLSIYVVSFFGSAYYTVNRLNRIISTGKDAYLDRKTMDLAKMHPRWFRIQAVLIALVPVFNTFSLLTFIFNKEEV